MSKESKWNEKKKILLRMYRYTYGWKFQFYFGFLVGCTLPLFTALISSYPFKLFIHICTTKSMADYKSALFIVSCMVVFGLIIYPLCFGMVYVVFARATGVLRKEILHHTEKLPVWYIESKFSGDLVSRITTDYNDAVQLIAYPGVGQMNPFSRFFSVIVICIIILLSNIPLGLISVLITFLNITLIRHLLKPIAGKEEKVKAVCADLSQSIVNALSGIMVARMFGVQDKLQGQYKDNSQKIYTNNVSIINNKSVIGVITNLQMFITFTLVIIIGLILSRYSYISVENVIFIANLQLFLSDNITNMAKGFADLERYFAGAKRMFELLDAPEEEERESSATTDPHCTDVLRIEKMGFKYEVSENPLFEEFNCNVRRGEKLAVVGGSGGGKSTLFKLLLGFFEHQKGDIYLYNHKMSEYSIKDIRKCYSYVSQDCYLFDDSIYQNVLWGNPSATREQVLEALKAANMEKFIHSLKDGVDTMVGEQGAQLSGGQRQRIAIARAILKDSPIILLDEATSALDSQSETEVQKALEELMKNRTSIIIAHRLSTIENADRIIVLEHGKIVEEGTHSKLLSKKGRYYQLYNMQYD